MFFLPESARRGDRTEALTENPFYPLLINILRLNRMLCKENAFLPNKIEGENLILCG